MGGLKQHWCLYDFTFVRYWYGNWLAACNLHALDIMYAKNIFYVPTLLKNNPIFLCVLSTIKKVMK